MSKVHEPRPVGRIWAAAIAVLVLVAVLSACEVGSVTHVRDGDTIEIGPKVIRLIGVDTPERGDCGYAEATARVQQLVGNKGVIAVPDRRIDNTDRYGRLLRYVVVKAPDGSSIDVGRLLIAEGLAIARYDGLDGYGRHARQDDYRQLDARTPDPCNTLPSSPPPATNPPPSGGVDPRFGTCGAAKAAGYGPYYRGTDPEYDWYRDADNDGIVCE